MNCIIRSHFYSCPTNASYIYTKRSYSNLAVQCVQKKKSLINGTGQPFRFVLLVSTSAIRSARRRCKQIYKLCQFKCNEMFTDKVLESVTFKSNWKKERVCFLLLIKAAEIPSDRISSDLPPHRAPSQSRSGT